MGVWTCSGPFFQEPMEGNEVRDRAAAYHLTILALNFSISRIFLSAANQRAMQASRRGGSGGVAESVQRVKARIG